MTVRPLTLKQKKFLESYMQCMNASKASIAAGYGKKNANKIGHQLMHHPVIAEAIKKRKEESEKKRIVSFNEKVEFLWSLAQEARQEGQKEIAIKSLAEINKMCGHYAPERSYNVNVNENREVKDIQEIRALYTKDY